MDKKDLPVAPKPREREPPNAKAYHVEYAEIVPHAGNDYEPEGDNNNESYERESMNPVTEQEINIGKGHGYGGDCGFGFGGGGLLMGLILGGGLGGGFGGWGRGRGENVAERIDEALIARDVLNSKFELSNRIGENEKELLRAEGRVHDKLCGIHHAVDLNAKDALLLHERHAREIDGKFCGVERRLERIHGDISRIPNLIKNANAKASLFNQMMAVNPTATQAAIISATINEIDSLNNAAHGNC